jgi:hypothetical protein
MPGGWFRHQEVAVSQYHREHTVPMVDDAARRVNPNLMSAATNRAANVWRLPLPRPSQQFFSEVPLASRKAARAQTWIDQAVVACALERVRLARGQFPDTLAALVPQFIAKLPTDLIDGQPLRYHRTGDGYILYSVGWNKTDDGGQIGSTRDADSAVNAEEGDWVWSLPR